MAGTEDVFGSYSDYEAAKYGGMMPGGSTIPGAVAAPPNLWGILKNKKKASKYLSEILGNASGGQPQSQTASQPQSSAMQWGQLAGGALDKLFRL